MTGKKPNDLAASVRARLLQTARDSGEEFQYVLTRYALERLLYRLSRSNEGKNFVLKGAMLFQLWTGTPHRPTRDLDLLSAALPRSRGWKKCSGSCAVNRWRRMA